MSNKPPPSDSTIARFTVSFYDSSSNPRVRDPTGRTLDDILSLSDDELEYHHDFIQYLFPLPEPSPINPRAPVLSASTREAFLSSPALRRELLRAFERMLAFYGFKSTPTPTPGAKDNESQVSNSSEAGPPVPVSPLSISPDEATFARRASLSWLARSDHNHLRITRIIRCLRVLGLELEAKEFVRALKSNDGGVVGARSKMFWDRAAERPLWMAPHMDDDTDPERGVQWLRN